MTSTTTVWEQNDYKIWALASPASFIYLTLDQNHDWGASSGPQVFPLEFETDHSF
jgi:hypothetical protein